MCHGLLLQFQRDWSNRAEVIVGKNHCVFQTGDETLILYYNHKNMHVSWVYFVLCFFQVID